jgi:hypothetical protein
MGKPANRGSPSPTSKMKQNAALRIHVGAILLPKLILWSDLGLTCFECILLSKNSECPWSFSQPASQQIPITSFQECRWKILLTALGMASTATPSSSPSSPSPSPPGTLRHDADDATQESVVFHVCSCRRRPVLVVCCVVVRIVPTKPSHPGQKRAPVSSTACKYWTRVIERSKGSNSSIEDSPTGD